VSHDVLLTDLPIELDSIIGAVRHLGAGNVSVFVDVLVPESPSRTVTHVEYDAIRPVALADMQRCVDEIARMHPGARIAVTHRLGRLAMGDVVLVAAVSAPNRSDAITACGALVLAVKTRVPIGKREIGDVPLPSEGPPPLIASEAPAPMTKPVSNMMTPTPYALDAAAIRQAAFRIGGPMPAQPTVTVDIEEHELEPLEGYKSPYPDTLPPAPIRIELDPKRPAESKRQPKRRKGG
jgi:molybdopterin synthase catalytic subunit